jgi:6-phosphogluconate dehydrogenase (decarboxylating)
MAAKIGVVGLGVMGGNLARNIERHGFPVAGYDLDAKKTQAFLEGPARGTAITGVGSPALRTPSQPITMAADPRCANTSAVSERLVTGANGALQNVFVYVKDGLGNYVYDTPTEAAKIDQMNCRYHPHVFGMRVIDVAAEPVLDVDEDVA